MCNLAAASELEAADLHLLDAQLINLSWTALELIEAMCLQHCCSQLPTGVILDLIRTGHHPFDLQGISHLLPRVQQQIGQLLAQYHRSLGVYSSFASDVVPKDRQAQLGLFSAVIRLVPFLKPEHWTAVRPLDFLPS